MRPSFASYVALGDSMSIDAYPGPGLGGPSLLHRNRDDVHPEFAGRDLVSLDPAATFTNLARDGATTRDVLRVLDEERVITADPCLVTVTAGGNDLLGATFRGGEDAAEVAVRLRRIVEVVHERLRPRLVVVATIYDPTDGVGDLWVPGQPHRKALAALRALNEAIRSLAGERVRIADVHDHFLGHGSHHDDPTNPHHDPTDPTCWVKLGIEPNQRGGSEVRRVLWDALG
ncbi:MAG: GDSL-type esterase/lipase family protein [Planctomycetes bacterium]|nr:GDSL-type esterase/lipase family protein [Planctomycetota bacterium]